MRIVIQRVTEASVTIEGTVKSAIGKGYLILLGVCEEDNEEDVDWLVKKVAGLRVFDDENGVMNRSIIDIGGEALVVSQFTLYADCKKGNRPSFINAGKPDMANELYEYIIAECEKQFKVEKGIFGADMKVELLHDGPFTVILDSEEI